MKQRRTRNILFCVVALIWGLVIWRFVAGGSERPGAYAGQEVMDIPMVDGNFTPDSFSLSLQYRDPFLGGFQSHRTPLPVEAVVQAPQPVAVQPRTEAPPVWINFRYHGLVKDAKNDRRTGLLTADGRMIYVDEGMQYKGFRVIHIYPDSIHIRTEEEEVTLVL